MKKNVRNTRLAETRHNEMLTQYSMEYVNPLDVPDSVRREGYSYKWVLKEAANQPTYEVQKASAQGWTLVPADRDLKACHDPYSKGNEYICVTDVILMERPSIFSKRELEALNDRNNDIMRSLEGVTNDYLNDSNPSRLRSF